jgi:type I restriction-modification system DNA methylase subunit
LPASLATFRSHLERLIAKFEADKAHYLSKDYSEAQARIDFVTPFFKALGWDVENEAGLPHHAREVMVEKSEEETHGKPDYSFRLGGQTKFFVEAKVPCKPLDAARHILQAKGYAWNTKQVFFVILTDFEEFRFYDASIQPDERKPDEGLLVSLKYADYLKNAEKLWDFSKERVAAGSLDAMLPRDRRTQRLRIPVDKTFLDEMTGWREDLARNVFKNNPELTAKQLNEVVQRLLDRIVFIRIAEDRRIIEKMQLWLAVQEWKARGGKFHIFDWLNDLFHRINEDFNGEIFKPHLSESIKIDSEVLAKIIERLYPPKSPYRFDVIGVELLGSIYERYLGKTIRPTAKQVRVEEKPEVRKAGGVYYTPQYIVDYIVKNTVGKVIEGKTPKQIEKIRILDPACGSGSFLIGAFQYLIDYHVRYLTAHSKEAHIHPLFPDLIPDGNGGHRLSVRLKARILRRNLFGVDIDPQAVEITMMSLYLKALEGEKSQLPPKQSLLPELKYNIICGNSLIGPDIYDQGTLFADEERDRINAFDWYGVGAGLAPPNEGTASRAPTSGNVPPSFGRIMKDGGFDCVIGNPPWGAEFSEIELNYLRTNYRDVIARMMDSYIYFFYRATRAGNTQAPVGFIVPSTILNQVDAKPLRGHLLKRGLLGLASLGEGIFGTKVLNTSTIVISAPRRKGNGFLLANVSSLPLQDREPALNQGTKADWEEWKRLVESDPHLTFFVGQVDATSLLQRLRRDHILLRDVVKGTIQRGVSPDVAEAHVISKREARAHKLEKELLRPSVRGTFIKRYHQWKSDQFIIYTSRETQIRKYPNTLMHLEGFKGLNTCKEVIERNHPWWSLHRPRDPEIFASPKLIGLTTSKTIELIYDASSSLYVTDAMYVFQIQPPHDPWALMAILQSKPFLFLYRVANQGESRVIPQVKASKLEALPYPKREPTHPDMIKLSERSRKMLELNKQKHSGKLAPSELDRVEREIARTDEEIDNLVYNLYGVTDEERKTIEGSL